MSPSPPTVTTPARAEGSARDRLLAAADELFYQEGVHSVGIDRVIERAGVAKASLYAAFGSKEELVRAYLARRASARQERIRERIARHTDPRGRILAVFDLLSELAAGPRFRGCAFVNASAEAVRGEPAVRDVCVDSRAWTRALFVELAREAGAADPERLGRELVLLHDGAIVAASMDGDPAAVARARALAERLLDREAPARATRARKSQPGARTPARRSRRR